MSPIITNRELDEINKLSNFELINKIEQYDKNPTQCPIIFSKILLKRIKPVYDAMHLVAIGGEALIIKAKNTETGKLECFKIARLEIQGEGKITPKHEKNVIIEKISGFLAQNREKEKISGNARLDRFFEGCRVQEELYDVIVKEKKDFSVPKVLEYSKIPFLFLRQEFIPQSPILKHLKEKKSILYSLSMFKKVLSAFNFVHYNGIINRDIKSENIFWNGENSIVILDWNLAKNADRKNLTVAGTRGGTPGHAPVKFMSGDFGSANFLDDYVNLGFLLWEFATYEACPKISYEKYSDVHFEEYRKKIVDYLPDALQATFWKATECKEKDRYQSLDDFRESIENVEKFFREAGESCLDIEIPEVVDSEDSKKNSSTIMLLNLEKNLCLECSNREICHIFDCKICNQIVFSIQELKKENYI